VATANLFLEYYGIPAEACLTEGISQAKAADRLNPVTVIVPSMYAGVTLRRYVGRVNGLINVRFMVIPRLAEYLGSSAMAERGKSALTPTIKLAAIRHHVSKIAGRKPLGAIAGHPPLHEYLVHTFEELDLLSPEQLTWLAGKSELTGQVVEWYLAFKKLTQHYYDREELALGAAGAVDAGSADGALKDLGQIIFYLPTGLTPGETEMVKALGKQGLCKVILGITGEKEADGEALNLALRLETVLGKARTGASAAETGPTCHLLVAPDPYEEVRQVVRNCVYQAEKGTPFHQVAVLYRSSELYGELVKNQLELAGIPAAGPDPLPLKDSAAGRALLNLLNVFETGLSREALIRWVAESPVKTGPANESACQTAALWEEVSGKAGIVGGARQWQERLELYQAENSRQYRQKVLCQEETATGALERDKARLEASAMLKEFTAGLWANQPPENGAGWAELAGWATEMMKKYTAPEHWSEGEQAKYEKVISIVEELGRLGVIEPGPITLAGFTQSLKDSLGSSSGRLGATGTGVFTGRLSSARGMNFRVVHILGMAEGAFPPHAWDDAVIPDRLRLELGKDGPLRLRKRRRAEERLLYLAARAGAGECFLSFARSGGSGGRRNYPAAWLIEEANALHRACCDAGEHGAEPVKPVNCTNLEQFAGQSWLTVIKSHYDSLAGLGGLVPAEAHDYDMHSLAGWHKLGKKLEAHYLARTEAGWRRAIEAEKARRSVNFTAWDGSLVTLAGSSPRLGIPGETPRSPTQLERWATCPFKYFLTHILKIEVAENPEEVTTISALDRGSLVHSILERFVTAVIDDDQLPERGQPWNNSHRELLMGIARKELKTAEESGITGRRLFWNVARDEILDDLEVFLKKDFQMRAKLGTRPVAVEWKFGFGQDTPDAALELPGGRKISFRGVIDRIDAGEGTALVIDYKTGGDYGYSNMEKDPLKNGTRLQLPVYALAAKKLVGEDCEIKAAYWLVSAKGRFSLKEMELKTELEEHFKGQVAAIVTGIENGLFPANPGGEERPNCAYCDYASLCPADSYLAWERKSVNPELAPYLNLAGGTAADGEEE